MIKKFAISAFVATILSYSAHADLTPILPPASPTPDIAGNVDQAVTNYLSLQTTLNCKSFQSYDFILEAAELVGNWCRAQNKMLKENGCGEESDFCVDSLISADIPQRSVLLGIAASGTRTNYNSTDTMGFPIYNDGYYWTTGMPNMPIVPLVSNSWNATQVSLTLSVGVDFVMSKKNIKRRACVNPLVSPYVEFIAKRELQKNQLLRDFDVICNK